MGVLREGWCGGGGRSPRDTSSDVGLLRAHAGKTGNHARLRAWPARLGTLHRSGTDHCHHCHKFARKKEDYISINLYLTMVP
jgi:hypothetical protein